jgi:uncharacterized membrane protein YqiK
MSLTETADSAPSVPKGQQVSLHALPIAYRPLTNRFHKLDGRSKAWPWRAIKRRMVALRADFGQAPDRLAEEAIRRTAELMTLADLFRTAAITGHANIETATRLESEVRRQRAALMAMRRTTALTAKDIAAARRREAANAKRRLKRREAKAKAQANGNGATATAGASDVPPQ